MKRLVLLVAAVVLLALPACRSVSPLTNRLVTADRPDLVATVYCDAGGMVLARDHQTLGWRKLFLSEKALRQVPGDGLRGKVVSLWLSRVGGIDGDLIVNRLSVNQPVRIDHRIQFDGECNLAIAPAANASATPRLKTEAPGLESLDFLTTAENGWVKSLICGLCSGVCS